MPIRSSATFRIAAAVAIAVLAFAVPRPTVAPARADLGVPSPCDLPGAAFICDVIQQTATAVASATADFIMHGVTAWVTNAAVWVTGKVGALIDATASPDVRAGWFEGQYASMLKVAGALALPMLFLALIQAVIRQDIWMLLRSAFGYLPMAFILAGAAIVTTQLVTSVTDDLSGAVVHGLGGTSTNLLQSVGDAYKNALNDTSSEAIPLFGIFLGSFILAAGAFVLWLEMVIRDAAIYVALFFLPLTFVAMIWPAASRWARRLIELLVAVILAKFVIVSIISLASAAITNTTLGGSGGGSEFERMIAGAALLLLAAWSPFGLLRLIPMVEVAAAAVGGQRAAISNAAGSAGVHSPASYMRQAMDRHSRASTSPASSGTPRTTYPRDSGGSFSSSSSHQQSDGGTAQGGARSDAPSEGAAYVAYAPPSSSGYVATTETQARETTSESEAAPRVSPPREPPSAPPPPTPPPDRPRPPRLPRDED